MSYDYFDMDWYSDLDGDGVVDALDIDDDGDWITDDLDVDDDGDWVIDTNEPVGVSESSHESLGTQYYGTGTGGTATAGWDIHEYYGDSWYGGQPLEYDYGDYYPDYVGPGSNTIDPDDYGSGYYGDEYSPTF
jgi:hypothetical protein